MRNTSLEEELRSGKTCVSTTVGDSMEPMLRNRRDTIIIEPVHGRLKRYDLPLYRRPDGKYVLHRILHVKKEGYIIEFYRGEKHISVRYPTYRLYVHLWCDLFLIRAAILRIKNKLQRIKKARTAQ